MSANAVFALKEYFGPHRDRQKAKKPKTSNIRFVLNTRLGFLCFVGASVFLLGNRFVQFPYSCSKVSPGQDEISTAVSHHCLNLGTYRSPTKPLPNFDGGKEGSYEYHNWFGIAGIVIAVQSLLFLLPQFLWKHFESDKLINITFNHEKIEGKTDKEEEEQETLAFKAIEFILQSDYRSYFLKFFCCESLFLLITVLQTTAISYFLQTDFSTYGFRCLSGEIFNEDDLTAVFPKKVYCFPDKQRFDTLFRTFAICDVNASRYNELAYYFLWFVIAAVGILSTISITIQIIFLIPHWRIKYFYWYLSAPGCIKREHIAYLARHQNFGFVYIMILLSKNLRADLYRDFVESLSKRKAEATA